MPTALPASFAELQRQAEQQLTSGKAVPGAASSLAEYVPPSFTWTDLARALAPEEPSAACVVALRACLDEPSRLMEGDDDAAAAAAAARQQIFRFVARTLAPLVDTDDDDTLTASCDDDDDDPTSRRAQVLRRCALAAADGVAVLEKVWPTDDEDDHDTLFTLIALADRGQPWTTDAAAAAATDLLEARLAPRDDVPTTTTLLLPLLQRYLRPLFARARPPTVTPAGRPAAYKSARPDSSSLAESPAAKPWKYRDLRAVSVAAWAVARADAAFWQAHWPLLVPVVLALVDDGATGVRARGLIVLREFVVKAGGVLYSSGLDRVLADAVFPTLLFLPPLTPEAESVRLLGGAYEVLLALGGVAPGPRSAGGSTPASAASTGPGSTSGGPGAALLDRTLRDGIYPGYFHARDHGPIVAVLCRAAARIVAALGLAATKHLPHLVPLLAGVLADPFAVQAAPAAVSAALATLQALLAACWPRFAGTAWQGEATRALCVCWLEVGEVGGQGGDDDIYEAIRRQLVQAAATLVAILRAADVDLPGTLGVLVAAEPLLSGLFNLSS